MSNFWLLAGRVSGHLLGLFSGFDVFWAGHDWAGAAGLTWSGWRGVAWRSWAWLGVAGRGRAGVVGRGWARPG